MPEEDDISAPDTVSNLEQSQLKRKQTRVRRGQNKRNKSAHDGHDYRALLNSIIKDVVKPEADGDAHVEQFSASQHGTSKWSGHEKELLLVAVERLGRTEINGISAAIRSKSVPEVIEYLRLLQEGSKEQCLTAEGSQLLKLCDIPAAFELGSSCCKALDEAAEALDCEQREIEIVIEKKRFGDFWLLDQESASTLAGYDHRPNEAGESDKDAEGQQGSVASDQPGLRKLLSSLRLLNLKNWLQLSERVFMNSATHEDNENWRSIGRPQERPSMHATAFVDFHNLTISLVRRLIHSTLFQTMSRLRATDISHTRARKLIVRKGDVFTALNVLCLEHNSDQFWIGVARRCSLEVYDTDEVNDRNAKKSRNPLDDPVAYDEVERRLNTRTSKSRLEPELEYAEESVAQDVSDEESSSRRASIDEASSSYEGTEGTASYDEGDACNDNTSDTTEESNQSSIISAPTDQQNSQSAETVQDDYAEAVDKYNDSLEEKRLWKMLKQKAPLDSKPQKFKAAKAPKIDQDTQEDLIDWRDRVDFLSEWERFGMVFTEDSFPMDRIKPQNRGIMGNLAERSSHETTGSVEQHPRCFRPPRPDTAFTDQNNPSTSASGEEEHSASQQDTMSE